jgi:hopanoid biosynthesis associated RND transporter like protein HpnN
MNARTSLISRLVGFCADHAWIVVAIALVQAVAVTGYSISHFAMSTDTRELISPKLDWRVREAALNTLFPPTGSQIVVVIDGHTPELTEQAAAVLAASLKSQPQLFHSVRRPDAGEFWSRNGLLYLSLKDVQTDMARLIKAEPFLGPIAADPSMRGLMTTLSTILQGVASGAASLADLENPMAKLADALESFSAGKPTFFSWDSQISDSPPDQHELRRIILVGPNVEFNKLEPGKASIEAIRESAAALRLDAAHGVRVRLTGPVPLQSDEFGTLAERAALIAALALGAIVLMLRMAVRSAWLIAAILTTTLLGLVTAAAIGLAIYRQYNVISVAFIPLFVGLGIDIGIQFSVRYRAERMGGTTARAAIVATGRTMGRSLTLAATAIMAGFLAFVPTDYYGVSQLGVVAGLGMLVALALNLTVLPALIQLTQPPGAPERGTDPRLARIDDYVLRHRRLVVGVGVVAAGISMLLMPMLHFDFNPTHLRSPTVESVETLVDLTRDPDQSPNTIEVIRSDLKAADALAAEVGAAPEVHAVRTLSSFIPTGQAEKIAVIDDAANLLDLSLNPLSVAPPPTDAELVDAFDRTAADLEQAVKREPGGGTNARRLAAELRELAKSDAAKRSGAAQLLMPGFQQLLAQIRDSLRPEPITLSTLPHELVRDWVAPDGRARVSILPRGDSDDVAVLTRFVVAVQAIVPDATGTAVALREAGHAVVGAFMEAGVVSFVAITALLFFALRRLRDVAITMAPIVLTGLLTMGSCVLIHQSLNFANIIALPLLFGIGVAFHIYFVMSWRSGGSHLLTSSLARAVFFSALATATGFGSLWASSHPGTASMGKLLIISLVWTLVSALLFQPALMGAAPSQTSR